MSPIITTVLWSSLILLALGILFGVMLGYFSKVMAVNEDPRIVKITELMPGANCGACGFAGCANLAESMVQGKAPIDRCKQLDSKSAIEISSILGIEIDSSNFTKKVAIVRCQGSVDNATQQVIVKDVPTCKLAVTLKMYAKTCLYSCIGYGDCANVCPYNAITIGSKGLPVVDNMLCTGCGLCVSTCPRKVIELIPYGKQVLALCNNQNKGKEVKDACKVGCIACMLCVKKCPKNAIRMENNLPVIDRKLCDVCGICVEACPMKTIRFIHEA